MYESMKCLRCGAKMRFVSNEKIQLGQASLLLGMWGNLAAGSMKVVIYACPDCGKLEFYRGERDESEEPLPQQTCPRCGKPHDFDFPRCPHCGYDYYEPSAR